MLTLEDEARMRQNGEYGAGFDPHYAPYSMGKDILALLTEVKALRAERDALRNESTHTIRLAQDIEEKWPRIKQELEEDETVRAWIRQYVLPALRKTADKGCCWPWSRTGQAHDEKCPIGAALTHLPEGVRLAEKFGSPLEKKT